KGADQIEKAVRENAGLIVDKMLQAAPEGDEAADPEEGPDGFVAEDEPEADAGRKSGKAKREEAALCNEPEGDGSEVVMQGLGQSYSRALHDDEARRVYGRQLMQV